MRKRRVKNPMKSFAIVTKSPAEALFFEQMKKDCRFRNMMVNCVEANDLNELIKKAQSVKLKNGYDRVWAIASLSDYNQVPGFDLEESLKEAKRRKVRVAYAKPSIFLYFALHFTVPAKNLSNSDLIPIIKKQYPNFEFTRDYLLHAGTEFHLKLFKYKGVESANEREFNRDSIATGDRSDINFIDFLVEVAQYCGDGDIAYNQKTIE